MSAPDDGKANGTDGADAAGSTFTGDADAFAAEQIALVREIERLAQLPRLDYERQRKAAAKRLRISVTTLDAEVRKRRPKGDGDENDGGKQGRAIELPEPEPWDHPVNGATVLSEAANALRRFVIAPTEVIDTVVLWCALTWCFSSFPHTPRLALQSPEKRCGKSTMLDVCAHLSRRPLIAASMTPASVFRTIEKFEPTLLFDEAEMLGAEGKEELLAVLNMGHRAQGQVIRLIGDDHEPRAFCVFAPAAFASIRALPDTLQDRSIVLVMRRKLPGETVESLRPANLPGLRDIARKLRRFIEDARDGFVDADPEMPPGIGNRLADNWRPLLAIADAAGGVWGARARAAAVALMPKDEGGSVRARLLADIRAVFDHTGGDRITSEDLVKALVSMEGSRWAEWKKGKAITKNQLALLLKPFGISPTSVRIGESTPRGYYLSAFADVFDRYASRSEPQHRNNWQKTAKNAAHQTATGDGDVADRNPEKPQETAECCGVADRNGGDEEEDRAEAEVRL